MIKTKNEITKVQDYMISRLQVYIYYKESCEPLQKLEIGIQATLKQILIQIKSSITF